MSLLVLGLILFLGVHSVGIVAPAWRDAQLAQRGEKAWKGLYSLVSLVGFILILVGYGQARLDPLIVWQPPAGMRHAALLLMLPVFPLLLAAYLPGRLKTAARHPMLLAVKLWALAHLLANGGAHDLLLFGAFLAWAVADRISVKRRSGPGRVVPGAPASRWNDAIALVGGLALYVFFLLAAHTWLIGVSPLPARAVGG
jgi:uncharacterized membrane protein